MTADQVFTLANGFALIGWVILALTVVLQHRQWISGLLMWLWPLTLAAIYTGLIVFFFGRAQGGFDSLPHVQLLFTSPWAALAGWVHYLAFDYFIGCWIALQVLENRLPRLGLVLLLPATFLFGPIGLLAFWFYRIAFTRSMA